MTTRWFLAICALSLLVAIIGEPKPANLIIAGAATILAVYARLRLEEHE